MPFQNSSAQPLIPCTACPEPYGEGITNAQLSVLKGLEAAKRHNYTFVVPPVIQWWAESDPSYLLILPFSHFYSRQHFRKFADEYGRSPWCTRQQKLMLL